MMNQNELKNAISDALNNVETTEAVELTGPLFDELKERGIQFTTHDGFLTASYEGDSETICVYEPDEAVEEAIAAVVSMLEVYEETL
jgi:hypothetical protein